MLSANIGSIYIQQTVSTTVTQYLLDVQPGLAVVLAATTGANTERYVHAPRAPQAGFPSVSIHAREDAGSAWHWSGQDGLSSVRQEASSAAAVEGSRNLDAYGNLIGSVNGTIGTPYHFTGEILDGSGLLDLRARRYTSAWGVFNSLDPFEGTPDRPMSLNGYSWVEGNTPNLSDPAGFNPINPPVPMPFEQFVTYVSTGGAAAAASFCAGPQAAACAAVAGAALAAVGVYGLYNALVNADWDAYRAYETAIASANACALAPNDPNRPASCDAPALVITPEAPVNVLPTDGTGTLPMPYPGGLDPRELGDMLGAACGVLLLTLLGRLIKIRTDDFERSRDRSDPEEFVGYHGTAMSYVPSLLAGVKMVDISNFRFQQLGIGFYVSPELRVANWYAAEASKPTNVRPASSPAVLRVWVRGYSKMRGLEVPIVFSMVAGWSAWSILPLTLSFDYLTA